ncbi:MAG: hypothetical protein LBP87_10410 [Planctomycetaceae bacterium]|jgi:hypothetical protein|nr:hypothetical protein [Planctomycetaceae bacterium]
MYDKSFFFLAVFVILLTSCSQNIKITGTVKFDDGEPLTRGTVIFESPTHSFPGYLDEKGHYAVGDTKDGAGIPPGDYTVWIAGTALIQDVVPKKNSSKQKVVNEDDELTYADTFEIPQVHPKYTRPNSDALKFTVKRDVSKTFDITVERPPKK